MSLSLIGDEEGAYLEYEVNLAPREIIRNGAPEYLQTTSMVKLGFSRNYVKC